MKNIERLIVDRVEKVKGYLESNRMSLPRLEEEVSKCKGDIKRLEEELAEYKKVWELIEKEEEVTGFIGYGLLIEKEENDIDINDVYEGKTNG